MRTSAKRLKGWMGAALAGVALAVVAVAGVALASTGHGYAPPIHPRDFTTRIDNPYMPWKPGTVYRYRGKTGHGTETDTVTVTRRKKTAMGERCVVVHDLVLLNGKPEELTYDYYAQDRRGNVWYFGEDSNDYHHGHWVRNSGSWLAGVKGAQPGIVMEAHPKAGDRYRQEYWRGHAEDRAKVLGSGGRVSVRYGRFAHTLATAERTRLEPKVVEHKYYARGIGDVKDVTISGGTDHSQLVSITHRR